MSKNLSFVNEYDPMFHVNEVLHGRRRFENAAQGVSRMIAEAGIDKISRAGRTAYDFKFFRQGSKYPVGWFEEINDFVHFVKDAAEGGSAKENAFVLVGEPGNGKTFFLDYTCAGYRQFLSKPGNRKFTFDFVGLDIALGFDLKVAKLQSLTFEDPMILIMNLYEDENKSKEAIAGMGFNDKMIDTLYSNYRPLGASTEYLWHELLDHFGGDLKKVLEHVQVAPVPIRKSLGITTGKYSAKDKITSSSVDLLGEESLQHIMLLGMGDPNRFDLRRGALARVAGSGVHFADELFKNKKDLTQVYLDVIQNRNIVLDGFIWPIDTLIIATSNNAEYNRFVSEEEEAPIKDRCRICYVGHNTDYILQQELTRYAIGSKRRTTITGEDMHEDPNLNFATSVGAVLTRLITQVTESSKLNVVEMMKLEAGQTAGEKGLQTLAEIKDKANSNRDVTKRWGQKGLGQRSVGRALQILEAMPESNEGKCLFAKDIFSAMERVILDYVAEATDQENFREALEEARKLYRGQIKAAISNAYRDDPNSVRKDVMNYVNSIFQSLNDTQISYHIFAEICLKSFNLSSCNLLADSKWVSFFDSVSSNSLVIPVTRYSSILLMVSNFWQGVRYSLYSFLILPFSSIISSAKAQCRWKLR